MLPLLQEQGAFGFRFRELLKICAGYLGGGECASIHRQRPPRHDRNITLLWEAILVALCLRIFGSFF